MAGSHSCRWCCPHGRNFEDNWQPLWRRNAIIPEAYPCERFMYVYHGTVWSLHQVPQRWKWQSLDILVVVEPTWTSSRFCWDSSDHPERENGCYAWQPYAVIPWCFAYDRLNYARYLPYYYTQMSQQPTTHPDVHAEFMQGGFSVQFGSTNPFGRIPVDQTIKQTTNKDRQTPGEPRGSVWNQGLWADTTLPPSIWSYIWECWGIW